MDELELLKKDWQKEDSKYPKLTYNEIYKMILKKSSSIVKWIFIISILEFLFWAGISFLLKDASFHKTVEKYNMNELIIPLSIFTYIVLIYFFYLFWRNYRRISATDNTKKLMENILRTRRTVRYYVGFNLIMFVIGTFVGVFYILEHDDTFANQMEIASANGEVFKVYAVVILTTVAALTIVVGILLGFYYLVYGLLLKRLNNNYRELRKLEV